MNDIDHWFKCHPPKEGQTERYEALREDAKQLAHKINALAPGSREKSIPMRKLREAVMWANAAIACNE